MICFTTVLTLATAVGSVSAHWRDNVSNITEIHKTGTHLGNETSRTARNLSARTHGAAALIWDDNLSASAQAWSDQCKFEHSQAGQNLAAGTGGPTPATAVGWWNDESADYDPNDPQPSHWTQVVWKSSTRLGCAMTQCAAGTIFPEEYVANYFVCHYSPYGNDIGQFPQNVQK
ncbi:unnamed protein product [Rhizoctonia solani]|uniref:SCP domain-containing protein n=1 Tax=Rhizoctonia solani TaxID=456999 RepID=A0A8H3AJM5_9AGAM|nr:unnamed protein product [Rhizoctonia solani]